MATIALLTFTGCNLNHLTVSTTAPVLQVAARSFAAESDLQLAREAAPAQLKTAEGFLAASPANRTLLEVVAQGYIEYAFGFLEDDLESLPNDDAHADERQRLQHRITELYDRALSYALRLVDADDKSFDAAFKRDASHLEAEVRRLKKKSVPGLFLAGLALVSSINLNRDDLTRVVELPKAVVLLERVHQLDPSFYHAGSAMLLGTIAASQGRAMGGNPERAKVYFDEAIGATGGAYLLAKVMMARYYAVVTQDRPLFESTLRAVVATPGAVGPSVRLANELAKRRAVRYLGHVEDYF